MASATPPDPNSGAAGTVYQTILALRAQEHHVDALWRSDLGQRIRHGNLYYLLELPWAFNKAIAKRAADHAYDVIQVSQPYAWRAAKTHQLTQRPGIFVNRSHGWEARMAHALTPWRKQFAVPDWRFPRGVIGRPMRTMLLQYAHWAARWSDGVIVSCTEDRDFVMNAYGLAPDRIACIPLATPSAFIEKPLVPMTAGRARRILYVGGAAFVKGTHVLAKVFSQLAEQRDDLEFTWCTPANDHAHCRGLLAPIARDRVSFVDWMAQDDLINLYDHHGIFLFPSFAEGFGKAFLEAMARGLVVIGSNTGGMRDVIRQHETGCVVNVGDVNAFCHEVTWLRDHPDAATRISAAASESARTYSWARVASASTAFYESLLERKRREGKTS